jgi:hypothetical protein
MERFVALSTRIIRQASPRLRGPLSLFVCDAHGDQIDWLMQVEKLSRKDALELLENWDGPRTGRQADTDDAEKRA